jgi:ATP-binding protein involved in chromosome partitioning
VIENMAYLEAADGSRAFLFGEGGAERAAASLSTPFLGAIPLWPELREASDAGEPLAMRDPDGRAPRAFAEIAGRILAGLKA